MMGTRVPIHHQQHHHHDSYVSSSTTSLHDLNINTVDTRPVSDIDALSRDVITDDTLDDHNNDDDDDDSSAVVSECMHESYRNALPLHSIRVEEDHSSIENNGSSRDLYNILTIDDISPIETARTRFLDIIVDHFINPYVIEVPDSEADYTSQSAQDKLSKKKSRESQYEGDARFVLPLMYVANMYETLVNEVNIRLSSLNGMREKTIGVALEAAGGLYRKLAKKFPRKGSCIFKRRELATSFETRSRFPELVIQEEKRVRFVVVNGLDIIEKPTNMHIDDAKWFKRLTGRNEVAVCAQDYKFYAPRRKYRRLASNSVSNIPLPPFPSTDNSSAMATARSCCSVSESQNQQQAPSKQHMQTLSHQVQFHSLHHGHQHPINPTQHATHFSYNQQCGPPSHSQLPEVAHAQQSSSIPQHMACLQSLGHVGGRLHVLPTSPAKFCDECGAPYLREASKFCSECGVKRLGT